MGAGRFSLSWGERAGVRASLTTDICRLNPIHPAVAGFACGFGNRGNLGWRKAADSVADRISSLCLVGRALAWLTLGTKKCREKLNQRSLRAGCDTLHCRMPRVGGWLDRGSTGLLFGSDAVDNTTVRVYPTDSPQGLVAGVTRDDSLPSSHDFFSLVTRALHRIAWLL